MIYQSYLDAIRLLSGFCGLLIVWEACLHITGRVTMRESEPDTNAIKWLLIGMGFVIMGDMLFADSILEGLRWHKWKEVLIAVGWSCWAAGLCVRAVSRAQHRLAAFSACGLCFLAFFIVSYFTHTRGF